MNIITQLWHSFIYHHDVNSTTLVMSLLTITGGTLFHIYEYNNNVDLAYAFGLAYYIVAFLYIKSHKIVYHK